MMQVGEQQWATVLPAISVAAGATQVTV